MSPRECLAGQRFNAGVQPALVAGCLVLFDDAAIRHSVDHRHGRIIGGASVIGIASVRCRDDLLDFSANQRSQARVVRAALVVLTRALSCLG